MECRWKFQWGSGGGRSQKPKILKESMKLNLNFPGGWKGGSKQKTFHGEGVDIFWNDTLNKKFPET